MIDPLKAEKNAVTLDVPFTQYLRPDGRKRAVTFSVQGESATKASCLLTRGSKFEVEELTTGEISLSVTDPFDEDGADLTIELSSNGPELEVVVPRLIATAYDEAMRRDNP